MMRLAQRTTVVTPSAVREILKVAEQPEVRSFAGGLPAPELFPVEAIAEAHARVLRSSGAAALQSAPPRASGPCASGSPRATRPRARRRAPTTCW